ncbi:deoxyuridine 5'-triphosphate nucleotidohydrolase [Canna indica]|uniref:Deoxyuridine 5'-triphosphate nucleotidohydrolase n=1 Tax=Canna indica TaxID=4628 RepID=A0AAQ3QPA0_9LILI|nr:deoxyuridine 5'-triphosphate nucleotidohydrolase [Canna indica]
MYKRIEGFAAKVRTQRMGNAMAGIVAAKSFPRLLPLYTANPNRLISPSSPLSVLKPGLPPPLSRARMVSTDALNVNGSSPDAREPSPKIPKVSENGGVHEEIRLPLLRVKKLSHNAVLPSRASALSAGYDLSSAAGALVPARGKALVPTDLSIAIPDGTYARIAPRSGLTWKHSIDVGAGVIDADYRGPVGVILFNHSDVDFEVKAGDRIAQLIIENIMTPEVAEVLDLDSTVRGDGGFGSTGV